MCPAVGSDGGSRRTVEVYVRSLAPGAGRERLRDVVRGLEALERTGALDAVCVRVTGTAIPSDTDEAVTDYGAFLARRVALFAEWTESTDRTLDPGFDRRVAPSPVDAVGDEYVVPPELAMAEFDDGRLRFVSPCFEEGVPVTVEERLAALEFEATGRCDGDDAAPRSAGGPRSLQG